MGILATFDPLMGALKFHIFRSPSPLSSHLREIEFIFEQFSNFYDNMKSVAVLTVLVFALLVLTSPQNSEASVIDDFMVSAEKATTFFQGADAAKAEAELALEAAEVAAKLPAE